MIPLYEHFVLCRTSLLSSYWTETCNNHKEGNFDLVNKTWADGTFPKIMKSQKNKVLSDFYIVAVGDVFHSFLRQASRSL